MVGFYFIQFYSISVTLLTFVSDSIKEMFRTSFIQFTPLLFLLLFDSVESVEDTSETGSYTGRRNVHVFITFVSYIISRVSRRRVVSNKTVLSSINISLRILRATKY